MQDILQAILTQRLIGIIRMKEFHHPVEVADAVARGGPPLAAIGQLSTYQIVATEYLAISGSTVRIGNCST